MSFSTDLNEMTDSILWILMGNRFHCCNENVYYSSCVWIYNHDENFCNILFFLLSRSDSIINNVLRMMFVVLIYFFLFYQSRCSVISNYESFHDRFQAWFPYVICITHNCCSACKGTQIVHTSTKPERNYCLCYFGDIWTPCNIHSQLEHSHHFVNQLIHFSKNHWRIQQNLK